MTLFEPLCPHGEPIGQLGHQCSKCIEEEQDRLEKADSPFIQTLRSIGGVKPCLVCNTDIETLPGASDALKKVAEAVNKARTEPRKVGCKICHGTGTVLDLAPLLAKPKVLENIVREAWVREWVDFFKNFSTDGNLFVVGPQRAHSLVYEVARQLGGTCLIISGQDYVRNDLGVLQEVVEGHYNLKSSLPVLEGTIPPDATCLFVTDRMDVKEIVNVINITTPDIVGCRVNGGAVLPYVLSLVSSVTEMLIPSNANFVAGGMKVISLHQEKA